MFGLSRKTDYALLLLTALARQQGVFVSVRGLVRAHKLPYRFAAHVLSALAHAGIVEAREGVNGGYRLARAPEAIPVGVVLEVTEGTTALVSCLDVQRQFACPQKAWCTSRRGMGVVQQRMRASLQGLTVADLIHEETAHVAR